MNVKFPIAVAAEMQIVDYSKLLYYGEINTCYQKMDIGNVFLSSHCHKILMPIFLQISLA